MSAHAWMLTSHWLASAGTLLLLGGSGAQAWNALMAYREELEASGIIEAAKKAGRVYVSLLVPGRAYTSPLSILVGIFEVGRLVVRVGEHMELLRSEGERSAQRLKELIHTAAIWLIIMYGAMAVFGATLIQLFLDYR